MPDPLPDLTMLGGTCRLCGCSDEEPCLGGVLFPALAPSPRRMVDDPDLLAPGETCCWMDEDETVCSAHSAEELDAVGILGAPGGWPFEEEEANHG